MSSKNILKSILERTFWNQNFITTENPTLNKAICIEIESRADQDINYKLYRPMLFFKIPFLVFFISIMYNQV